MSAGELAISAGCGVLIDGVAASSWMERGVPRPTDAERASGEPYAWCHISELRSIEDGSPLNKHLLVRVFGGDQWEAINHAIAAWHDPVIAVSYDFQRGPGGLVEPIDVRRVV